MNANGSEPKQIARELLEEAHPALVGLSHWIHANPELGFQETLAAGWVSEWLTSAGFEVTTGVAGMPTAVMGSTGPGPFHIAVCAEYDALPGIGHACGHNVIAAAGVGAGVALAAVAEQLGLRVTVLGTPAEEGGGGKIRMIDEGVFEGVHAALMVHPWPSDVAAPTIIAVRTLEVTYIGREAHAAGYPHLGINAGDALVVAQAAIGLLRQHLLSTDRVHGIVTKGGDAPNIVPAHTTGQFMVRAADRDRLDVLTDLVRRCFEAGALATGCDVAIKEEVAYSEMRHDAELVERYRVNAEALGRMFDDAPSMPVSSDMGDVSLVVPAIHPMIGVDAAGAVNHQPEFAAACASQSADRAVLDGAIALAWTAIDAATDAALRARLMGVALATEAVAADETATELAAVATTLVADADAAVDEAQVLSEEAGELIAEAESLGDISHETADIEALVDAAAELDLASAERVEDAFELAAVADVIGDEAVAESESAEALLEDALGVTVEASDVEPEAYVVTFDESGFDASVEPAFQPAHEPVIEPAEAVADVSWEPGAPADANAADDPEFEAVAREAVAPETVEAEAVGAHDAAEDIAVESPPITELDRARRSSWESALASAEEHATWNDAFAAALAAFDAPLVDAVAVADEAVAAATVADALDAVVALDEVEGDPARAAVTAHAPSSSGDDDWWIGDPEPAISGERSGD